MLPAYKGAVLARMERAAREEQAEPVPELNGDGSYEPAGDENQHMTSHRIAQAQPVVSAEALASLVAPAPGVGMWGEVVKAT